MVPELDHTPPHASSLLEEGIRMAANSFPVNTGLGGDNIAPRALARLSSPSIKVLIALFLCVEAAGAKLLSLCSSSSIPKPDGGRRPIGLCPTIIPIWMRARVWVAR